ncbi:hypothetical protein IFT68_17985 [Oxalobacteraceae sp. CFBP 13730]|nr:hypothetical protein [Oxalobacteraceae sp. CFBP 13730]
MSHIAVLAASTFDHAEVAAIPTGLATHRAYIRVFQPRRLTFGFIALLKGYPDSPAPTLENHAALAHQADLLGFAAI